MASTEPLVVCKSIDGFISARMLAGELAILQACLKVAMMELPGELAADHAADLADRSPQEEGHASCRQKKSDAHVAPAKRAEAAARLTL